MGDIAHDLFNEISAAIERMPVDGLTCDGVYSEDLHRDQRQFVEGMRYARVKAFKFLRHTKEISR